MSFIGTQTMVGSRKGAVLLYFFTTFLSAQALNLTISDEFVELASVVLTLAQKQLKTSVVVMAEHSVTAETSVTNIQLMNYLLMEMKESVSVQLFYSELRDRPRSNYIFIVDSVEAFRVLRKRFNPNKNNRNFYFLIILSKFTPDFNNVMKGIFNICLLFKVINANIILHHPQLGVCMYISRFFTENECRSIQPSLYFIFKKVGYNLETLFPPKHNYHRCPIRVTSRLMPPILEFSGNISNPTPVGKWKNLGGIEGYMLKLLASKLNFTIDLLPFPSEKSLAFDNGTAYGCFADLLSDRADIAIGAFSASDHSHEIFSTSKLIHHSPLVYVYKPLEILTVLRRLSKPFSLQAWKLLLGLNIFGASFILFMRFVNPAIRRFLFGKEVNTPLVNFSSIYLGYPIARMPHRNFARFLLAMWLFLSLVIRSAYQGALYDAIRMDSFFQNPSGVDELIRRNYTFVLPPDIALLKIIPQNRTYNVEDNEFEDRFKMIERSQKNYVTVAHFDSFKKYMAKAYLNGSRLSHLSEVIFMFQVVMYFPKNSIFLQSFDRKLAAFDSAGITKHLSTVFTSQPALFSKIFEEPPLQAFGNKRLLALYQIYICMTAVALVVFGLELLSIHFHTLRQALQWIN